MPDERSRLDVSAIPPEYLRTGQPAGASLFEYVAALSNRMSAQEPSGRAEDAGRRLVYAAFHLRSADVGRQLAEVATSADDDQRHRDLTAAIGETPQFLTFAGANLTISSVVTAMDLCAAAIHRLDLRPVGTPDMGAEADIARLRTVRKSLPADVRSWLQSLTDDARWRRISARREEIVHRHFRMHHTITIGGPSRAHQIDDVDILAVSLYGGSRFGMAFSMLNTSLSIAAATRTCVN